METNVVHWSRRHFFTTLAAVAASLGIAGPSSGAPKWKVGDKRLMSCPPPCNYGKITTWHHHWMQLEKIVDRKDGYEDYVWVDPHPELLGVTYHAIWSPRWKQS